jgi:hypothetical protein
MASPNFNYKKIRSEISLKYEVELDETATLILFILQEEQKQISSQQHKILEDAAAKINNSSRCLSIDSNHPRWQAFWFGFGQFGLAFLILIISGASFYTYHLSEKKEKEKLPAIFNWYKHYYELSNRESKSALNNFLKNYPLPN